MMKHEIELITDFPAIIADMLINDTVDISLVPVATILSLAEHHIITDYCIGTNDEVASVCLFSDVPINNIETILLDYQSRSSVGLLKILLRDFWNLKPELIDGETGYENKISGSTAGLVIGDRAFLQRKKNKFIYDLGSAWKEMTGMPFVFAAWIANKRLSKNFITNFNNSTSEGLKHLPEIIASNPFPPYNLNKYYTENISFDLDDAKKSGLKEYLKRLKTL